MAKYAPELIQGKNTLRSALEYHGQQMCLDECPEDGHDDTCLVLLAEVLNHHVNWALLDTNIQDLWEAAREGAGE